MHNGQEVRYIDADDASHAAVVRDIVGAGASGAKRLDLTMKRDGEDVLVEDVPHEDDAETGSHFWLLSGERRTRHVEDDPNDVPPLDVETFPERDEEAAVAAPPAGRKSKAARRG